MASTTPLGPGEFQPQGHVSRELPDGPRMPGFAQAAAWVFWPVPFIESCARRFGGMFTLRFAGMPPIVAISDPKLVKEVFTGDPEVFSAGRANFVLKPLLGTGSLLLLDGARHMRERKLLMPAFHGERMTAYGGVMRESIDRSIDGWPIGERFALHRRMQDVTIDVIMRTVFGLDEPDQQHELRKTLVGMLALGDQPGLMLLIGRSGDLRWPDLHRRLGAASPWRWLEETITGVDRQLLCEVRKRRAQGGSGREDVLSLLLSARDEQGGALSDGELVDEMKTMLLAGHETSATALTWTVLELLQNPETLRRLREDLPRGDEYLDAVIRESLRLHPIVPMIARLVMRPACVGGIEFPAGTVLAPNIYLAHRNASVWPDPERFDPERFLGTKPNPYEFFPFGGGVRRCIGLAFALFEMRIVLRRIAERSDLRLVPGYKPAVQRRGITFAVAKGLPVVCDRLFS